MRTLIIAEAGVNHNGSEELALRLVDEAARAGADIVKFQTFRAESIAAASACKADYQRDTTGAGSQLDMLRALELSADMHRRLIDRCRERGIRFLSTPFDAGSVDLLRELGMDLWKIPSGEITNLPLLRKIGALRQDIILSTGMCTLPEVSEAVRAIEAAGTPRSRIILLHCTTQYPTPPETVNLRAMDSLATLSCRAVGYSDHTEGITVPVAAVARGAAVIEKHFTLDRSLPGPDHRASLEPDELARMVHAIRLTEVALGSGLKEPSETELPNRAVARKSIVAACRIAPGEVFTEQNLATKRPGTGLSPMLWDSVIGKEATRAYDPDDLIFL